jgi:hypothetical protein
MPKNKYSSISEIDSSSSGYSPYEEIWQSAISQTPGVFDYAELDKKYPTRQVRPIVPPYIQQEIDEDALERKEQFATQRIREAQASIYESQLNEKIQAAEQIPLARKAFSQLNPQDPKYPEMRDEILMNYPYVESDTAFMKSIVGRNDRVYENYFKKNLAIKNLTTKDVGEALKEIAKFEEIKTARGTDYSPAEQKYIDQLMSQVDGFYSSQGTPNNTPTTTQSLSFSSVEEADSAGLPKGTIVYINGRKARID